jgi:hypothetical protein
MEAAQSSRPSLGEIFVQRGLISEADLERALAEQAATNRRLADILVRRGLVTGHDITTALKEQLSALGTSAAAAPAEQAAPAAHLQPVPDVEPEPEPVPVWDEPVDAEPVETDLVASAPTTAAESQGEQPDQDHEPQPELEPEPEPEVDVDPAALLEQVDSRREAMEAELSALGPILDQVDHLRLDLEAHDLSTPLLSHELVATQERLVARGDTLSTEIAALNVVHDEIERTAGALEEIRAELQTKIDDLAELRTTAAIWTTRVAEVEAEAELLTARADDAARELNALAAQTPPTAV